ncbi:MAG: hypothetical protein C5B58_03215 [Acidobacteria bacterium]|nr:MAG: hypothetical protein C5B58_03215 [Acidobacteriota bacterium]
MTDPFSHHPVRFRTARGHGGLGPESPFGPSCQGQTRDHRPCGASSLIANLVRAAGWTTGIIGSALKLPGVQGAYAAMPGPVVDTLQSFTVTASLRTLHYRRVKKYDPTVIGNTDLAFCLRERVEGEPVQIDRLWSFSYNSYSFFTFCLRTLE